MKAKRKEIKMLTLADLKVDISADGAGTRSRLIKLVPPPKRQAGRVIEADADKAVAEIVAFLKNEAKVL